MHRMIAVVMTLIAMATVVAQAELPTPKVEKPAVEKKADKNQEAKKEETPTPPANGVIEVMPDGKIKWGADHDTVAKVLLKTIQDYDRQLQKQRLLNDILLDEVAKLRGGQR